MATIARIVVVVVVVVVIQIRFVRAILAEPKSSWAGGQLRALVNPDVEAQIELNEPVSVPQIAC